MTKEENLSPKSMAAIYCREGEGTPSNKKRVVLNMANYGCGCGEYREARNDGCGCGETNNGYYNNRGGRNMCCLGNLFEDETLLIIAIIILFILLFCN